jgi:hypothetical protein
LKIGREGPLRSPLIGSDASLGFRDLSLQVGYRLALRLAGRTSHFANPESRDFHCLQGGAVLLELNPVPSDVAIAVSDHVGAVIVREGKR